MLRTNRHVEWDSTEAHFRGMLLAGLRGDERAYLRFLTELTSHLRGYFRKRATYTPNDVEDLVQETLLAIHNSRHTYDADQPVTAWVHAIARYKLVDVYRARVGRESVTDEIDVDSEVFAVQDTDATEAHIDVESLLDELPDRFRLPIRYVKLEGLTVSEAAKRAGMSESAVKVGIHRGLKVLAARIRNAHEN